MRAPRTLQRQNTADASVGRTVVLVEGISDQRVLQALAARRDRDLDAESISVVPIGGAQAIGRFLELLGPRGLDLRVAGLCDAAEEGDFRRGLERSGFGSELTRDDMERLGFYVCVEDLEDEPARQRAVLVLRDVLGWPARDVAELLDDSVASVNSALQRARATLERERAAGRLAREHAPASSDVEAAVMGRFLAAWELSTSTVWLRCSPTMR
jgi:predicted ATP-dependent endonuclease of OLD family